MAAASTFVQQTGGWVIAEGVEDGEMLAAVLDGAHPVAGREPVLAGHGHLLGRPQAEPVGLDDPLPLLVAALEAQVRVAAGTAVTGGTGR